MLADAIKARIPLISVTTDDLVNAEDVLQSIAASHGKKVQDFTNVSEKGVLLSGVYWTLEEKHATLLTYQRFQKAAASLVILNPAKPSSLVFDAGTLPVPPALLEKALAFVVDKDRPHVLQILRGLSIKTAMEVVNLTIARTGGLLASELRKTRRAISGTVQGLIPLDTDEEFYIWPPAVLTWLDTNQKFFEDPKTPHKLVPRGMMLEGTPGVGKTALARALARRLKVPLYRLDIAQALDRYIGVAENRVARSLQLADQEEPCVLLLDEVEKIFSHSDDNGVVTRILSQMLWWLADHKSRVLTVMTTNHLNTIPPELYRPGRLDAVFTLPRLGLKDAKAFTAEVYKDVMGNPPPMAVMAKLREAIEATGKGELSHSEVAEITYETIKRNGWN